MQRKDAPVGISNRETASQEAQERIEHPAVIADTEAPEDAAVPAGSEAGAATENEQTSRKAGIRSAAQKASDARYGEGSMPASRKVQGAFGKEGENRSEPE